MALRDQPYIPLYVQDIMTDEKLNECSAATHGIYIKGIMCLMHKSEQYGKILLKQKDKQTSNQIKNFALKLDRHLPYTVDEINEALTELINEEVCCLEGDVLSQKRMIKDNELSLKRSRAGAKGGKTTQFAKANIKANGEAKSENEYENENVCVNDFEEEIKSIISEQTIIDVCRFIKLEQNQVEVLRENFILTFNDTPGEVMSNTTGQIRQHFKNWCRNNHRKFDLSAPTTKAKILTMKDVDQW